jgi:regulatory protein YycI of two-component signal transduction system YycFG
MIQSFREKIRSLNKNQQNILVIVLVLINISIFLFWFNFWTNLEKPVSPLIVEEKLEEKTMEENIKDLTAPTREEPISEAEKQRLGGVLESLTAPKK